MVTKQEKETAARSGSGAGFLCAAFELSKYIGDIVGSGGGIRGRGRGLLCDYFLCAVG